MFFYTLNWKNNEIHVLLRHWCREATQSAQTWHDYPWPWVFLIWLGVSIGPIQFESARKIWPSLGLLAKIRSVLAKFLHPLACSHFRLSSLPCSVSIICFLETKTDTGNNVSQFFNIGATCAHHECFWKNASSFCWRLLKLTGLSSVPGSRVTLPEIFRL